MPSSVRSDGPSNTTITDDPTWTSGDFEVITSHQVRFRVNTHLLLGSRCAIMRTHLISSKAFADAASLNTGEQKIEFVGGTETAPVFRLFLSFLSDGRIQLTKSLSPDIYHLVIFLQKWDCPDLFSSLLREFAVAMALDKVSPIDVFFIAARLRHANMATISLRSARWEWFENDKATAGIIGRCVFDPRGWPLSRHREWQVDGSPEYLWALSRAYDDCTSDLPSLPARFREYLALTSEE